jgi:type IV pilus assembly protein PilX
MSAAMIGRRQSGMSLVIVLILLVAMSLLGIAILRSTAMQERMSANLRDRSLAFQAAEATMRFAQNQVLGAVPTDPDEPGWDIKVPTASDCANFSICPTSSAAAWRAGPSYGTAPVTTTEYWIEYVGTAPARPNACSMPGKEETPDCQSPMYRVTVRSRAAGRADVTLQGNIISRIPEPGA